MDPLKPKQCPNCSEPNKVDSKFCAKCRMVLTYDAYSRTIEDIQQKGSEVKELKEKYEQEMKTMREEIQKDMKQQIHSLEKAQEETQKQLEELLRYRSKVMGLFFEKSLDYYWLLLWVISKIDSELYEFPKK